MLSDVTMGQFFPGKSVMHRLDPRIKMCLTVYFIVLIFCSKNFVTLGANGLNALLIKLLIFINGFGNHQGIGVHMVGQQRLTQLAH